MHRRRAKGGYVVFGRQGFATVALALIVIVLTGIVPADARPPRQQVTLRYLDQKSGKPIRNFPVVIHQWRTPARDFRGLAQDFAGSQSSRTNRNGEVIVWLAEPPPGSISIVCFDLVKEATWPIDIPDVLKSGVVLRVDTKTWKWIRELNGKPGEIVIYDRKRRLWERMLLEIP